jgi:hypothetical protein
MITPIDRYYALYSYGRTLAVKYSKRILANTIKPDQAVVLTHNYTPTYLISFASNFNNLVFLFTKGYDYSKDPIFNKIPLPQSKEIEKTYIKGLIYNARQIHEKIMTAQPIVKEDLRYIPKDRTIKKINIRTDVGIEIIDFIYQLDFYPALVLDATNFTKNVVNMTSKEYVVNVFSDKKQFDNKDDPLKLTDESVFIKNKKVEEDKKKKKAKKKNNEYIMNTSNLSTTNH